MTCRPRFRGDDVWQPRRLSRRPSRNGPFERVAPERRSTARSNLRRGDAGAARRGRALSQGGRAAVRGRPAPASAIPNCASPTAPNGAPPSNARAFAKFSAPGVYTTTVTQPADFRAYLLEQLRAAGARNTAPRSRSASSAQEIPYPYVFESGDELGARRRRRGRACALFSRRRSLADDRRRDRGRHLEFVTAEPSGRSPCSTRARVDYSLRRLVHYTGCDWRNDAALGPAHQLSPLCRPVRALGPRADRAAVAASRSSSCRATSPSTPRCRRRRPTRVVAAVAWHRFQMPAYHLVARGRAAASASSISASARRTPRTSPTISRCCARIAG